MTAIALRAEYRQGSWALLNPVNNNPISVDQILMDVESSGDGFAVGVVLAVDGITQEDASTLSPQLLRLMGVGYPKRIGRTPRGAQRMRCVAGQSRPRKA